ncbi:MAG: REP-associated tyrosine transposase [Dehalococcoidia bacterium]
MPHERYITRPRLRDFEYAGTHAYHITIITRARDPLLVGETARFVASELERVARATAFEILAYTIMPDHLHALVNGTDDRAQLIRFVQRLKQHTSHQHIANNGTRLWQPSFHDRVLRRADDAHTIAAYIIDNPRRAGLIPEATDWPHQGGTLLPHKDGTDPNGRS